MAIVKKLDSKRRAVLPEIFEPGESLCEEVSGNQVIYRPLKPRLVPEGQVAKLNGRLRITTHLQAETIANAVRHERNSI